MVALQSRNPNVDMSGLFLVAHLERLLRGGRVVNPYYSEELATLYHGDCLKVMGKMEAGSVDLVFTSPPYNLGVTTGGGFAAPGRKPGAWSGGSLANGYTDHDDALPYNEYVDWQNAVLRECWRLIRPTGAIYYQHKPRVQAGVLQTPLALVPSELPIRQIIIWHRGPGMNFAPTHYVPVHEWIVVIAGPAFRLKSKGASGHTDVWRVPPASNNSHPAPFPQLLVDKALESTGARTVLDPFSGSGTTLRAAKDMGIRGVGIELSETYCEMTVKRLAQDTLFGESA